MCCYLSIFCSRTHFAPNQIQGPLDIETEISGVHQSTTSCRLTEREGSITNLKDAEDDEKQFAEWKRLLKGKFICSFPYESFQKQITYIQAFFFKKKVNLNVI